MRRVLLICPFREYGDIPAVANLGELLKIAQDDENFVVQFDSENQFDCEIAMRFAYEIGNVTIIVDEAHLYGESRVLQKIIRLSRKTNTSLILISHSFFDFIRKMRNLIKHIMVFRNGEPYELSYIERINPTATAEKVKALKTGEYLVIYGEKPAWIND